MNKASLRHGALIRYICPSRETKPGKVKSVCFVDWTHLGTRPNGCTLNTVSVCTCMLFILEIWIHCWSWSDVWWQIHRCICERILTNKVFLHRLHFPLDWTRSEGPGITVWWRESIETAIGLTLRTADPLTNMGGRYPLHSPVLSLRFSRELCFLVTIVICEVLYSLWVREWCHYCEGMMCVCGHGCWPLLTWAVFFSRGLRLSDDVDFVSM